MVKKGFPKFGMSQAGAYVTALKNYNLPDFILKLVAKDTNSELLERGRIDDRLQSMNDDALELLNRINKATGNAINKKDVEKFYQIADDVKSGEHGTQLIDAIYGSSVGFKGDALIELENLSKSRKDDAENKLEFKTANFENRIYSVVKC